MTALGETDGKGLLDRGSTPLASTKKQDIPRLGDVLFFGGIARGVERAEKKTCRWHVFPLRRESMCAAAGGSARAERLPSPYREGVYARGVEGASHAYRHGLRVGTRFRL